MRVWSLRFIGIIVGVLAVYLAYLSSHQVPVALACSAGAAVLAILSVVFLWERPAIGSPLAAILVVAGIVAQTVVVPKAGTLEQGAASQPPAAQAARNMPAPGGSSPAGEPTSSSSETLSSVAFDQRAVPSPLASMHAASGALAAPQPGFDYSEFIGHGTIDDGMPNPDVSQVTAHALNQAVSVFGNAQATAVPGLHSPTAQKLLDLDAKLPESEYALPALAKTLPGEPVALYRFVRDNITTDPYNGLMRGPLGTWLGRAGSPSDKLSLLAWMLAKKGVPFQFVRGNLSSDEQARIVQSATGTADDATPKPTPTGIPRLEPMIDAYVRDGNTFARWTSQQLASSHLNPGSGAAPRVSSKHYWIQIDQNGKLFDLDPTLPDMNEGQHLAAIDSSFKPWAMLPDDEWHYVRIQLTAKFGDGTTQQVVQAVVKTADVAYAPVRLVITPAGGSEPSDVPAARKFDVALVDGGSSLAPAATLDLDLHGGVQQLSMEIDRKDSDGRIASSRRNLLPPGTPRQTQGAAVAGLTSILIVPGLGANAFAYHTYVRAIATLTNAVETATGGRMRLAPVYPIALSEYFARDESVADALAEDTNGRFYRDRPNIALERSWFKLDHGTPRAVLGFDIVDNGMGTVGIDGAKAVGANLSRGYADTSIENDVIHGDKAHSTIAIFDAANKSGIRPVVVTAIGNAPAAAGSLGDGLDQTLAAGHVAIAPNAAVSIADRRTFGWWDVDPSTGNAVGRMTGGAGEAMVDYALLLRLMSGFQAAGEAYQAVHECTSDPHSCAEALCAAGLSSAVLVRAIRHAHHVKSPWAFLAIVTVEIGVETLATLAICNLQTGGENGGGQHGGGGSGGEAPPDPGPPYCQVPMQCSGGG